VNPYLCGGAVYPLIYFTEWLKRMKKKQIIIHINWGNKNLRSEVKIICQRSQVKDADLRETTEEVNLYTHPLIFITEWLRMMIKKQTITHRYQENKNSMVRGQGHLSKVIVQSH